MTPPSPPPLLLLPPPPPLVSPYFTLYKYSHRLALSNVRRLNTKLAEKNFFSSFSFLQNMDGKQGMKSTGSGASSSSSSTTSTTSSAATNGGTGGKMVSAVACDKCRKYGLAPAAAKEVFFCEEPPKKRCGYCHGVTLRGISIYPHILGIICLGDGAGVQR